MDKDDYAKQFDEYVRQYVACMNAQRVNGHSIDSILSGVSDSIDSVLNGVGMLFGLGSQRQEESSGGQYNPLDDNKLSLKQKKFIINASHHLMMTHSNDTTHQMNTRNAAAKRAYERVRWQYVCSMLQSSF